MLVFLVSSIVLQTGVNWLNDKEDIVWQPYEINNRDNFLAACYIIITFQPTRYSVRMLLSRVVVESSTGKSESESPTGESESPKNGTRVGLESESEYYNSVAFQFV